MNKVYSLLSGNYFHKCKGTIRILVCFLVVGSAQNSVQAQLSFTNFTPTALIDFSNTMPSTVGTNTSTAFTAAGFSPNPTNATPGRLNSNAWASTGWSDGSLVYGATQTGNDFGRGAVNVAQTTGGIYAYTGAPNSVSNPALMFQPTGADFTSGTLTLKIQNTDATQIINQLTVGYNIYVRNDQNRSQTFTFSYSADDVTYTPVPSVDYATPGALDAAGWVLGASKNAILSGISIPATAVFYIRWTTNDNGGSGSRDEFGLDDINITANYPGACAPPTTNATLNAFTNVLSTQMDVNFTRGNGTGGILIVASPAALTQNPISGITYTANSNYGTGQSVAPGNGFVIYNSNAVLPAPGGVGSVTLTGLTAGTTYTINLFEYQVSVPCYFATGVSGTQMTLGASTTQATDAFRSKASGNWANASTWESLTAGFWISADQAPTSAAGTITVLAGHTVDISSPVSMDETVISGTVILSNSGIMNLNDGAGTDIDIQSAGILKFQTTANYTTTFIRGGTATLNVATGGKITIGNGASTPGYSPLGHLAGLTTWNNGAIYEWNTTDPFITNGVTYFPGAAAGTIPIFRVTRSPSLVPGAASATVWNGLMEVNANLTLKFAGTKTFRDGITGSAILNQDDDCGLFIITGTTAQLGGTGAINLNNLSAAGGMSINSGSVVTMISDKIMNQTNSAVLTLSSGGSLYCDAFNMTGTTIFTMLGTSTLRLGSTAGITSAGATGNIQTSGARTFSTTGNYIYNGTANQATGNGLPTSMTSLTINNTGGAGNKTVTLTTTNTTTPSLTLTAGLFAAGAGQQLNISTGGTVTAVAGDFANGSTAGILNFPGTGTFSGTCSPYDVYVSGGVNFGAGTVTIQNGGSFRINTGGFANTNGPFYATGSTLIYNTGVAGFNIGKEWVNSAVLPARGGPHHVTILASGTTLLFDGALTARTMTGDLNISSGTGLTLGTAGGGDLNIGGNWTRAASGAFTNNARLVNFNSTTLNQTITVTGGGTEVFGYLAINKATAISLVLAGAPNATNITVNGGNAGGNALAFINGDIDLNQNTFNFTSWNGGQNNIQIDGNTAGGTLIRNLNSTGGQGIFAITNSDGTATHTVLISRVSATSTRRAIFEIAANVKLTIAGTGPSGSSGINFGINTTFPDTNIDGILQINAFGFVTTNAAIYGTGSTLIYNTFGAYNRGIEWSTTTGAGYPYNVTVQGAGTVLTVNNGTGDANRQLAGNLTISNGSGLILNNTAVAFRITILGNFVLDGNIVLPGTLAAFGADIKLAGNWTRSSTGAFFPNERAVFFIGSGNSTITASGGEIFPYLYLTKNTSAQTISLNDDISIGKILGITTGTLNLQNKDVTIKSKDTTASVNSITAGQGLINYSGTGRFIVERYIPTAVGAAPNHLKTWQFLAVPVNLDNQTVNAAWQEGQAPLVVGTSGLGTIISNNTAGTGGFDIVGGVGPSMKTYVAGTNTWSGISGTGITHYNQKGYMLFVRGDRSVNTYNGTSVPTTLRTRGKIMEPNSNIPPVSAIGANLFESIGNPYASAIDFSNTAGVVRTGTVQNVFYVWDPRLGGPSYGGYQTFTKNIADANYTVGGSAGGSYPGTPGITVYNTIQSGQAFFAKAAAGGGTIAFNENAKIAGSSLVTRPGGNTSTPVKRLLINSLYIVSGGTRTLADGALNEFGNGLSNAVDQFDAIKLTNPGENLGIRTNNKILAVERRANIQTRDTIHYNLGQLHIQQYQFEFTALNIARQGLKAFLIDNYLGTHTAVSLTDTTRIYFNIVNAPGSFASDRFMLVFIQKNRPGLYSVLQGKNVENTNIITWNTGDEIVTGNYEVERSADGKNFTIIHSEPVHAGDSYTWTDTEPLPGNNYYRIHNPDPSDKDSYSNSIKLTVAKEDRSITVFPNPVTNAILNLRFSGLPKGNYLLKLYNGSGQQILIQEVSYNGSIENEPVKLPVGTSKGIYKLEITYPGGKQWVQVFID